MGSGLFSVASAKNHAKKKRLCNGEYNDFILLVETLPISVHKIGIKIAIKDDSAFFIRRLLNEDT